jgi:hypothetical protein
MVPLGRICEDRAKTPVFRPIRRLPCLAFECGDNVTAQSPETSTKREAMNDITASAPRSMGLPRQLARRSAIDPFIVMDVMGEANLRQAHGEDIIHMEVG